MEVLSATIDGEGIHGTSGQMLEPGRYMVRSTLNGTSGQFHFIVTSEHLGILIERTSPGSFDDLIEVPHGRVQFQMSGAEASTETCDATVNIFDLTSR